MEPYEIFSLGTRRTNGKMARAASLKQASSSPKKEPVRSKRVTRLVSKKKTSINNSSTAKNTSGTTLKRPVTRLTNESKKQPDRVIKAKGKNTSTTASKNPLKKSTGASKKISDKEVKVKGSKSPTIKKQPVEASSKVQSVENEKAPSNVRKGRITKGTSQSRDETTKKKNISSTTTNRISKQISLKESFLNQTNSIRLRPRRVVKKKYCEDTVVGNTSGLEPNVVQKERVPIYKSIPVDEPENNTNEVYDFKFDKDDSTERIRKKKKRPPKQTVVQKLMKARAKLKLKSNAAKAAIASEEGHRDEENVRKVSEILKAPEIPEPLAKSEETTAAVVIQESTPDIVNAQDEEDENKENLQTSAQQNSNTAKNTASNLKPSVIAVESLKNRKVTIVDDASSPQNKDDFRPFRPTNVFSSKLSVPSKMMLNHSLLEKSLSPIVNTLRTIDDGSPWRAPPLYTFSQVKTLFQSTPQRSNIDSSVNKLQRGTTDIKSFVKSITPAQKQSNALNIENSNFINNQKKKPVAVTRRFGTEITNIDQCMPVHDQSADVGRTVGVMETLMIESESVITNYNAEDIPVLKENNDAKHDILSFQTPKKAGKVTFKKVKSRSPLKRVRSKENKLDKENAGPIPGPSGLQCIKSPDKKHTEKGNSGKEHFESTPEVSLEHIQSPAKQGKDSFDRINLEPIPGPSGLQRSGSPEEQRILRQSNLNNYLNLMDMPESIKITTPHGIFGDINSPVKSSKPLKKVNESRAEINNAFGFIEDITDENLSPAEQSVNDRDEKQPILKKDIAKNVPARLSLREIRNHLIINHNEEDTKNRKDPNTKSNKSPLKQKPHLIQDIANFSDTFDVISEACESVDDTSNVPLFADLEPSYFTEPPKRSYKRKRGVHFSFSDESDNENEDKNVHKAKPKRKKPGKMSKLEEKRLKAWVQDVNKTFEEIDHYDLVVE